MRNKYFPLVVVGTLLLGSVARADFYHAFIDYKAGKFAEASAQFLELAELGNGAAQFNLGAMATRGEGREKDIGVGVGWMLAASQNGYEQLPAAKLAEYKSKLTPEQLASAEKIVAKYGRASLERTALPWRLGARSCARFQLPVVEQMARIDYPMSALYYGQDGIVILDVVVGTDGLARDPNVLVAVPDNHFDEYAIDAVMKSRFKPAMRDGVKTEARYWMKITFSIQDGGALWKLSSVAKVRKAADKGDVAAMYLIGLLGTMDATLNVPYDKAQEMILTAAQQGQPQADFMIARQMRAEELCGDANKVVLWLRQSAKGNDAAGQVSLVMHQLEHSTGQHNVEDYKTWLKNAVQKENMYALKHAAAILASPPLEQLRDPALALAAAEKLKKFDDTVDPQIHEVMAAAFAANQNFRDAVKQQEIAIKKAKKLYWNTTKIEERLAAYRENRPATGDLFDVPPTLEALPPVSSENPDCHKKRNGCGRHPDQDRAPTGSFIKQ